MEGMDYLDVLFAPDQKQAAEKARATAAAIRRTAGMGQTLSILGDRRLQGVGMGMQEMAHGEEKNLLNAAIAREHYGAEARNLALTRSLLGLQGVQDRVKGMKDVAGINAAAKERVANILSDSRMKMGDRITAAKGAVNFMGDISPDKNQGLKPYRDLLFQVDRLNALVKTADGDIRNLNSQQVEEFTLGLHRIFTGANRTIQSQVAALLPQSLVGDANRVVQWLKNAPVGSGQVRFLKQMSDTIDREADVTKRNLLGAQNKMVQGHVNFLRTAPQDAFNIMVENGIPEDQALKHLETAHNPPKTAFPIPTGPNLGVAPMPPPGPGGAPMPQPGAAPMPPPGQGAAPPMAPTAPNDPIGILGGPQGGHH